MILGGGYTGMWTAWFLKEREPDLDIVLLEADICGGGPSGRNGGFCDGWWGHIGDMVKTYGEADALELLDDVRALPRRDRARGARRTASTRGSRTGGDLAVATSPSAEGRWEGTIETRAQLGVQDEYRSSRPRRSSSGAPRRRSAAGCSSRDAANVQPARLARGLRRVLLERGVRIYEGTPVTRFGVGSPRSPKRPAGPFVRARP